MISFRFFSCSVLVFAVFIPAVLTPNSQADDMYIWAEEVGGDVVFHHEGSIDLTDFPAKTLMALSSFITPTDGAYLAVDTAADAYTMVLGAAEFGTGGMTSPSSRSGDTFGVGGEDMALPIGYTSGAPISGSMTFDSTSFAALGVDPTPLTYDTTVGTNTIHLFTMPPTPPVSGDPVGDPALKTSLQKKIKKLSKKSKKLKKKGKKAAAKKLLKKVKKLKAQLSALG